MARILPSLFLLLAGLAASACEEEKTVSFSAINMMTGSNGPRYRIIREAPLTDISGAAVNLDQTETLRADLRRAFLLNDQNGVIGRDIDLSFSTPEEAARFARQEGDGALCNFYEIEGVMTAPQMMRVKRYRIIVQENCDGAEPFW